MYDSTVMPCGKGECCVPPSILNIRHSFSTDFKMQFVLFVDCGFATCSISQLTQYSSLTLEQVNQPCSATREAKINPLSTASPSALLALVVTALL